MMSLWKLQDFSCNIRCMFRSIVLHQATSIVLLILVILRNVRLASTRHEKYTSNIINIKIDQRCQQSGGNVGETPFVKSLCSQALFVLGKALVFFCCVDALMRGETPFIVVCYGVGAPRKRGCKMNNAARFASPRNTDAALQASPVYGSPFPVMMPYSRHVVTARFILKLN